MSKHTPGPWEARIGGHDETYGFLIQREGKIREICGIGMTNGENVTATIAKTFRGAALFKEDRPRFYEPEELEANARLIAAAPELLEACHKLASAVRNLEGQEIQYSLALDLSVALKECEAAIEKAERGQ